jgi:predicted nucleic acid-binding protein
MQWNVIFSEDVNDGQIYDGVKVVNPFAGSSPGLTCEGMGAKG